ncbi:MAG: hypothetical protein ACK4FL_03895 [Microgenomates group bacterium]
MGKLTKEGKQTLADKIMDLANLVFIGLVISQFVPKVNINPILIATGIIFLLLGYFFALTLLKKEVKK